MAMIDLSISEASYIRFVLEEKIKLEEKETAATKALAEKIDAEFKNSPEVVEPTTETTVETPVETPVEVEAN